MDLWIRTQDKSCLLKVDKLDYDDSAIFYDTTLLGRYKSKERALEVFDEIQQLVACGGILVLKNALPSLPKKEMLEALKQAPIMCISDDSQVEFADKNVIVYEMPRE